MYSGALGKVLVTGASGLVGSRLVRVLSEAGYSVVMLSHSRKTDKSSGIFHWDIGRMVIDSEALEGVNYIINLAGAGIADKRWSSERKKEIIDSRVSSAELLHNSIVRGSLNIECYITASATGFYGNGTSDRIYTEDDPPANDFLAQTCRLWEEGADLFLSEGIRTVKVRTGIVLARDGGFMKKISFPAAAGIFGWFGKGRQHFPWIHIEDLCRIYLRALENANFNGPYNAVAPHQVTQKEFMSIYAKIKGKPALKAGIPSFLIRIILGQMSEMLLNGSRVSNDALKSCGFEYSYPALEEALKEIEVHR
jgi:uncharacterized protein (TIGR01777 family)